MKGTIVVVSSNRGVGDTTADMIVGLRMLGAGYQLNRGVADVAFARNQALSWVCGVLREQPTRDMVLMLDDDIFAEPSVIQEVVTRARKMQEPCTAVYTTKESKIAGARLTSKPGYWLFGLGCMAIPRAVLLELEARSESYEHDGRKYTAFCTTGPEQGVWIAEDFRLCLNLGGVRLLPIGVAHVKPWPLWPGKETLKKLSEEAKEHEQA